MSTTQGKCWSCQSPIEPKQVVCRACSKIQRFAGGTDYFGCLGLDRRLQIDLGDLEKRFHKLSRQFHPDFYLSKGDTERTISLENSTLVNKAYRALKDPISRVEYLIHLEEGCENGIEAKVPQEFLEEIFELQETLDEFRSTPDSGKKDQLKGQLEEALQKTRDRLSDLDRNLSEHFARWDQLAAIKNQPASRQEQTSLIQQMKQSLSYRTYFNNLILDIEHLLQGQATRREIRH